MMGLVYHNNTKNTTTSAVKDSEGNIYIFGSSTTVKTHDDFTLQKLKPDLTLDWSARIDCFGWNERPRRVLLDEKHKALYVIGHTDDNASAKMVYVVKCDLGGHFKWQKSIRGYHSKVDCAVQNLAVDDAGDLYLASEIPSEKTLRDPCLLKLSGETGKVLNEDEKPTPLAKDVGMGWAISVVLDSDSVYISGADTDANEAPTTYIACYDHSLKTRKWVQPYPKLKGATLLLNGKHLYAYSDAGFTVRELNKGNGRTVWEHHQRDLDRGATLEGSATLDPTNGDIVIAGESQWKGRSAMMIVRYTATGKPKAPQVCIYPQYHRLQGWTRVVADTKGNVYATATGSFQLHQNEFWTFRFPPEGGEPTLWKEQGDGKVADEKLRDLILDKNENPVAVGVLSNRKTGLDIVAVRYLVNPH